MSDSDRTSGGPADQPSGQEVLEKIRSEAEQAPEAEEMSDEELEAEREERLDPENRHPHTEVDNTQRDFDAEAGRFND
jgi:hypothetical protein